MTGIDLIVVAPWIAFGVVLAIVYFLLLRSNHAARRGPARPLPPSPDPADPMPGQPRKPANRENNSSPDPEEARCSETNSQARLR